MSGLSWNYICVLLCGTRDPASSLYALRGGLSKTILPIIWNYVEVMYNEGCKTYTMKQGYLRTGNVYACMNWSFENWSADLRWPPKTDLKINMLPIRWWRPDTIPDNCIQYWDIIKACEGMMNWGYNRKFGK